MEVRREIRLKHLEYHQKKAFEKAEIEKNIHKARKERADFSENILKDLNCESLSLIY